MNETGKLGKGLISVIVLLALVLLVFFFRLFDLILFVPDTVRGNG